MIDLALTSSMSGGVNGPEILPLFQDDIVELFLENPKAKMTLPECIQEYNQVYHSTSKSLTLVGISRPVHRCFQIVEIAVFYQISQGLRGKG